MKSPRRRWTANSPGSGAYGSTQWGQEAAVEYGAMRGAGENKCLLVSNASCASVDQPNKRRIGDCDRVGHTGSICRGSPNILHSRKHQMSASGKARCTTHKTWKGFPESRATSTHGSSILDIYSRHVSTIFKASAPGPCISRISAPLMILGCGHILSK